MSISAVRSGYLSSKEGKEKWFLGSIYGREGGAEGAFVDAWVS